MTISMLFASAQSPCCFLIQQRQSFTAKGLRTVCYGQLHTILTFQLRQREGRPGTASVLPTTEPCITCFLRRYITFLRKCTRSTPRPASSRISQISTMLLAKAIRKKLLRGKVTFPLSRTTASCTFPHTSVTTPTQEELRRRLPRLTAMVPIPADILFLTT